MVEKGIQAGHIIKDSSDFDERIVLSAQERYVIDLAFSKVTVRTMPRPGYSATIIDPQAILRGETEIPQEK